MAVLKSEGDRVGSPREIANKSERRNLLRAIRMTLEIQSPAIRVNTQDHNVRRYGATRALPDYDALKDRAREIKKQAIAELPELLKRLDDVVRGRAGHVYFAATAEDACRYVREVCEKHDAKLVVKGKSMTSEEIHLNRALEGAGIEVAESDLAEFILQLTDEQPSHITAPAMHYSRERITALFKKKFQTDLPLDTGEELTKFARGKLREKFLRADVGITGANLIAADTGTLMLIESEGNIRMSSFLPPVHIAIAGVEKIISTRRDMAPFLELVAASGTGQKLSSYTSFLSPPLEEPSFAMPGKPRKPREFHLVLLDNGRLRMREDLVLQEALYCVRCSACLNACPNFQVVGGHAFGGETYSGGIGGAWEAGTTKLENARFSELCTGCSRCVTACPVRIDIPWLNENLRERLNQADGPSAMSGLLAAISSAEKRDAKTSAARIFFGNYHFFAKWGTRLAPFSNAIVQTRMGRRVMERWFGVDRRRALPAFSRTTLVRAARELESVTSRQPQTKAVLFADVYTNYGLVDRGVATIRLLRGLDVDLVVSDAIPEGRAALSQGMIATAKKQAIRTAAAVEAYIAEGRDILVLEPSSLAMFRRDFRHLLDDKQRFDQIRARTFEPVEFIAKLLEKSRRKAEEIFDVSRSPVGPRIFFHAHCQQRTIGCAAPTKTLFREIGFDVATSSVECCGMAGSFGYKKDFYDVSIAVASDIFQQVAAAEKDGGNRALVASGTSCTEQLRDGLNRPVMHPVELLLAVLKT
jgi:iron-sulfur cluster protein